MELTDREIEKRVMEGTDIEYMRRAIELAKLGEGWCHPNPMVGAVIVKGGRIIGEGYHRKCGELHAERNAIASLKEPADGATIYVTLEPCCHWGRTPPCTQAIIENKIHRVVIGSRDPNPKVDGGGVRALRAAGIEVVTDVLREECDAINPVFFHYITHRTPYVIMKYAMTLDGKIATHTGASKWITGEKAREEVQRLRHGCMAIMAGIGTVLADDPLLTCRLPGGRNPVRVICDSHLRIPRESQIVRTALEEETFLVTALPEMGVGEMTEEKLPVDPSGPWQEKALQLLKSGIRIINLPMKDCQKTDLKALMHFLGQQEIDSVLLEGGASLNKSALEAGIVSEIRAFIAPKIFGGTARSPVEGKGVDLPSEAYTFAVREVERFGEDVMLRCLPRDVRGKESGCLQE